MHILLYSLIGLPAFAALALNKETTLIHSVNLLISVNTFHVSSSHDTEKVGCLEVYCTSW